SSYVQEFLGVMGASEVMQGINPNKMSWGADSESRYLKDRTIYSGEDVNDINWDELPDYTVVGMSTSHKDRWEGIDHIGFIITGPDGEKRFSEFSPGTRGLGNKKLSERMNQFISIGNRRKPG